MARRACVADDGIRGAARAAATAAVFALAGALLSACGYRPLYATRPAAPNIAAYMSQVEIAPIPERAGHLLRNHLLDRVTPRGTPDSPLYRLDVVLNEAREGLAVQDDRTVTRFNLVLFARYRLVDYASGTVVSTGTVRSIAAYNVVASDFATLSAEEDARARVAREISEEIRTRLAIYFDRAESRT